MPRKTVKVAYFNLLPCEMNGKALGKAKKSTNKLVMIAVHYIH